MENTLLFEKFDPKWPPNDHQDCLIVKSGNDAPEHRYWDHTFRHRYGGERGAFRLGASVIIPSEDTVVYWAPLPKIILTVRG